MHALNMRKSDTQRQTKPVFDFYKVSLENVMDSNINNRVPSRNNSLQLSKLSVSALWLERAIPLLFWLLGDSTRVISSKNNNSSIFPSSNLSPKLPSNIVPNDSLNPLLKSDYYKL